MRFEIDSTLDWPDHFVEYGFCVIKGVLDRDYCRQGVEAFQRALGTDLPPRQWTTESLGHAHSQGRVNLQGDALKAFLGTVYDQPGIQSMIATMLGSMEQWSGERAAHPFLCIYHPQNKQQVAEYGHVDFLRVRIPIIGNAFVFQASLIDTEPYSGNITIYPGWHKIVQQRLLTDPDFWYADDGEEQDAWRQLVPKVEPYEFVAEAGDVLLMHHLVGHAGNVNAATHHTPRVAIHAQAIAKDWPTRIDPADPTLAPLWRAGAHHGLVDLPYDEREAQAAAYQQRRERLART